MSLGRQDEFAAPGPIKIVFWEGTGLGLFTKRLEHGPVVAERRWKGSGPLSVRGRESPCDCHSTFRINSNKSRIFIAWRDTAHQKYRAIAIARIDISIENGLRPQFVPCGSLVFQSLSDAYRRFAIP